MSFFIKRRPKEPIGDCILDFGDRKLCFVPQADISGLEACMVFRLWQASLASWLVEFDVESFLTEHNLWRHFTENGMPCPEAQYHQLAFPANPQEECRPMGADVS